MSWVGYKIHRTETRDADAPHLVVHVETTPASSPDENLLETIHPKLAQKKLLPGKHLVDRGYTDAGALAGSLEEFGVDVLGPVTQDPSWQAREEGGFDKSHLQTRGAGNWGQTAERLLLPSPPERRYSCGGGDAKTAVPGLWRPQDPPPLRPQLRPQPLTGKTVSVTTVKS